MRRINIERCDYRRAVILSRDDYRLLLRVARAAEKVCYWDWSGNDDEPVMDVDTLRKLLDALNARKERT